MQIEGVTYEVDWRKFKRGKSLFFPCLDAERAREQLFTTTNRLQIKVLTKVVLVDGIRGLRVWRL
jgi:hypothetical protein